MYITIKPFAVLRDSLGSSIEIEIESGKNVSDLSARLRSKYPDSADLIKSSRIANDNAILSEDFILEPAKELFLLPPSSGG